MATTAKTSTNNNTSTAKAEAAASENRCHACPPDGRARRRRSRRCCSDRRRSRQRDRRALDLPQDRGARAEELPHPGQPRAEPRRASWRQRPSSRHPARAHDPESLRARPQAASPFGRDRCQAQSHGAREEPQEGSVHGLRAGLLAGLRTLSPAAAREVGGAPEGSARPHTSRADTATSPPRSTGPRWARWSLGRTRVVCHWRPTRQGGRGSSKNAQGGALGKSLGRERSTCRSYSRAAPGPAAGDSGLRQSSREHSHLRPGHRGPAAPSSTLSCGDRSSSSAWSARSRSARTAASTSSSR